MLEKKIFTTSPESLEALGQLFNSTSNPEACKIYGGGGHCDNPTRNKAKQNLWGPRGDNSKDGQECKLPIFLGDGVLINIGVPGGTVIDRSNGSNDNVYEIGLFVADRYFLNGLNESVSEAIRNILTNCRAEDNYTKTIATFAPSHPYMEGFLVGVGASVLTESNMLNLLGENSLHPERFKFDDGAFYECSKWDQDGSEVQHDGWNSSDPCIEWMPKEMVVFEHSVSWRIASDEL